MPTSQGTAGKYEMAYGKHLQSRLTRKKCMPRGFPGGPVATTPAPSAGGLVRGLGPRPATKDPACHSEDPDCLNQDPAQPNKY